MRFQLVVGEYSTHDSERGYDLLQYFVVFVNVTNLKLFVCLKSITEIVGQAERDVGLNYSFVAYFKTELLRK